MLGTIWYSLTSTEIAVLSAGKAVTRPVWKRTSTLSSIWIESLTWRAGLTETEMASWMLCCHWRVRLAWPTAHTFGSWAPEVSLGWSSLLRNVHDDAGNDLAERAAT